MFALTLQYKLIIAAAILLGLGAYYLYSENRIEYLKKERASLQTEVAKKDAELKYLNELNAKQSHQISILASKNKETESLMQEIIANVKKINIVKSAKRTRKEASDVENQVNLQVQTIVKKLIDETTHK